MKCDFDKTIISMLFDRNESALRMIEEKWGRLIKMIAYNIFRSEETAEECLNDTLLDIWNTIPPTEPKSVSSYACMIARRRAIDKVRRESADKRSGSLVEYDAVTREIADITDTADWVINKMELTSQINKFLGTLPPKNREIFISRYFNFEDIESISKRLGVTSNSVTVKLHRMRTDLKEQLRKGGFTL